MPMHTHRQMVTRGWRARRRASSKEVHPAWKLKFFWSFFFCLLIYLLSYRDVSLGSFSGWGLFVEVYLLCLLDGYGISVR